MASTRRADGRIVKITSNFENSALDPPQPALRSVSTHHFSLADTETNDKTPASTASHVTG